MYKLIICGVLLSTLVVTIYAGGNPPDDDSDLSDDCSDSGDDENKTLQCTGPNEVYNSCVHTCPPQNCSTIGAQFRCLEQPAPGSPDCKEGCQCKPNYYRNAEYVCVSKDTCKKCTKRNEVYDECAKTCPPNNCSSIGKIYHCPLQPIPGSSNCQAMCRCAKGYYRNTKGDCVLEKECKASNETEPDPDNGDGDNSTPFKCDRKNEEYKSCPPKCPSDKCSDYRSNATCGAPLGTRIDVVVPCEPQCKCKEGYYRDDNGNCVKPDDCPLICPINEVYSSCVNGQCSPRNCSQLGKPIACPRIREGFCVKGCICAEGYLRDDNNGKCIPQDACQKCSKRNEVFDTCAPSCPPETCDSIDKQFKCAAPPQPGDPECIAKCRCKKGFYRNATKDCVPKSECKQCPANEVYSNCPAVKCDAEFCPKTRDDPLYCPIGIVCDPPRCVCAFNMHRDRETGECILNQNCPPFKCDGPNEVFTSCKSRCPSDKCTDYRRNATCGGPLGTRIGIVVPCEPQCECKKGYYRDNNNVCVKAADCPLCPANEIYVEHPNVKCDAEYCPQTRNDPQTCPSDESKSEPGRCLCAFNQRRNRFTGLCKPTAQCPPFPCNGPNEKYVACPKVCPGEQCSDYINNSTCPRFRIGIVVPCRPQCKCNEGYYRDSNGICIAGKECITELKNKRNESNENDDSWNDSSEDDDSQEQYNEDGLDEWIDGNGNKSAENTNPSNENDTTVGATDTSEDKDKLSEGNADFAAKFFSTVAKKNPRQSLIMSPISILLAIAPMGLYSKGKTHEQIFTALNLQTNAQIRSAFPKLLQELNSQDKVEFKIANKNYVNENYKLSKSFSKDTKEIFDSEAENINFGKSQQAADSINEWVEKQTNNRIKNLIPASALNAMTRLVIVNAIYFLGKWQNPFNHRDTQLRDYHVDSDTVIKINTMYRKGTYKYLESSAFDCKILEMPYQGGNFTFRVLLPNKYDGVENLMEKMQDTAAIEKSIGDLSYVPVKVYLPVMNISTSIDLKEPLEECGLGQMFDDRDSGLTGILEKYEELHVSDAKHKAFIKVDEDGSEAAAATGLIVGTTAVLQPTETKTFNADHPFVFEIRYKDIVLFIGKFVK